MRVKSVINILSTLKHLIELNVHFNVAISINMSIARDIFNTLVWKIRCLKYAKIFEYQMYSEHNSK